MVSPSSRAEATPTEVNKFHNRSDRDTSTVAQHHTLGLGANQSSPGDHTHDGRNSKLIAKGLNTGFPVTAGVSYNAAQIQAIIDLLRDLGAGT
jgi:hypothetical protein